MRRLAGELDEARKRTALELSAVSDFDKANIAPAKEALDKRGEEVQAFKAELEKLAHDMKQAKARHTTEAQMRTCARSARPHPRMHTCTHAARTRSHACARTQALDEITPLETKKAKIERDLHKERERADKFRGARARVVSAHAAIGCIGKGYAAHAEEARTVYETARDSVLREIPEVTTAAQRHSLALDFAWRTASPSGA